MTGDLPAPVGLMTPADIWAFRQLYEARPADPHGYLRDTLGFRGTDARRAADLWGWYQRRWAAAVVTLAEAMSITTEHELRDMVTARCPEVGPDELHHAWLIVFCKLPQQWHTATRPTEADGDIIPAHAHNRPGRRTHWPMG